MFAACGIDIFQDTFFYTFLYMFIEVLSVSPTLSIAQPFWLLVNIYLPSNAYKQFVPTNNLIDNQDQKPT